MSVVAISILIPTYNHVCVDLIQALHHAGLQACSMGRPLDFEILVADDGSTDTNSTRLNAAAIAQLPHARFLPLPHNVGRAAIRNFLVQQAQYPWLLLADDDAAVCQTNFLQRYIEVCQGEEAEVYCGGITNYPQLPSPEVRLRYLYERTAEKQRTPDVRNAKPYHGFTAFNCVMRRSVLLRYPFDERCKEYGYEDALLGVTLCQANVPLIHIDNPLLHTGLDTNAAFLDKVETALRTLHGLGKTMQQQAGVSRCVHRLSRYYLYKPLRYIFPLARPLLRRMLCSPLASVRLLQVYKLGYYCTL